MYTMTGHTSKGRQKRSQTQDTRSIPRRNSEHDTIRFLQYYCAPSLFGDGGHSTLDCGDESSAGLETFYHIPIFESKVGFRRA